MKFIINLIAKLIPINKKKILFQSGRDKIDCAPYAIYKYIKENCPNDYRCIWVVSKKTDISMISKKDYAYTRTLKGIYHIASSKYLIRSQSIGGILKKKEKQVYIQTWHGAGNFKKCVYDCMPKKDRPKNVVEHAKEWDYLIATDKYNEKVMRSSTNYNKKSIILGNADTDILVNATDKYKENIIKELNLDTNKKTILYAPTFRDYELAKEIIDLPIMNLKELDDCQILLRLHPLVSDKIKNINMPSNFINVCNYPNINDLYLVSDILITDYSSIIFPYGILEKPLIFYPYDYERYIEERGGFYLNYNKLPGPICKNENELLKVLKDINKLEKNYKQQLKAFNKKYNSLNDGNVCKRIVEELKKGTFDI